MTKRKWILLIGGVVLIGAVVLLWRSFSEKPSESYVEVDKAKEAIESFAEASISEINEDEVDPKAFTIIGMNNTIGSKYVYYSQFRVNMETSYCSFDCDVVGCNHNPSDEGCNVNNSLASQIAAGDKMFGCRDNQLIMRENGKDKVVYTNTFYTEYEQLTKPDSLSYISAIVYADGGFYLIGRGYYVFYDYNNNKAEEPVLLGNEDRVYYGLAVGENKIYYYTDTNELYCCNKDGSELEKLEDRVGGGQVCGDEYFYVQWNEDEQGVSVAELYRLGGESKEPQLLVRDCYVSFYVSKTAIYYQPFADQTKVYIIRHDGTRLSEIDFSDRPVGKDDKYQPGGLRDFIGNPNHDFVYIIDMDNKLAYVLKDTTGEYLEIPILNYDD